MKKNWKWNPIEFVFEMNTFRIVIMEKIKEKLYEYNNDNNDERAVSSKMYL